MRKVLSVLAGLAALAWFLVRVVPKPSRAAYPCQRVAFPLASSFIGWLLAVLSSTIAWRKARAPGVQCWKAWLCGAAAAVGGVLVVANLPGPRVAASPNPT